MNKFLKNKILLITECTLRTIAMLCATGTLMQTFLSVVGFSESQIYLHATLIQAANVSSIVLFSHFADCKRPFLRTALVQLPNVILFLCLLPFCFLSEATTLSFILLTGVSLIQALFTGLNTVMEYKLPYYIHRASDYGTVQAILGIAIAAVTFGVGELLHFLETKFPYEQLMFYAFIIAALFALIASICPLFFTALTRKEFKGAEGGGDDEEGAVSSTDAGTEKVSVLAMFRRPIFYLLIPANLLRGFASGVVVVFATVALSLGYTADTTIRMVSLSAVAHLVACFLFGLVSRYLSPRISILVCCLTYFLIPLCLLGSVPLFLFAYFVIFLGKSVIDVAVPSLLVQAVDVDIAGPYNAWRMVLHNGGTMLATAIAPFLSPAALLIVTLVCGVLSGLLFFGLRILREASPTLLRGRPHLLRHKK